MLDHSFRAARNLRRLILRCGTACAEQGRSIRRVGWSGGHFSVPHRKNKQSEKNHASCICDIGFDRGSEPVHSLVSSDPRKRLTDTSQIARVAHSIVLGLSAKLVCATLLTAPQL